MATFPIPRINVDEAEEFNHLVFKSDHVNHNLMYELAIPLCAAAVSVMFVLLCLKKQQGTAVVARRRSVDVEEGVADSHNWKGRSVGDHASPHLVKSGSINNAFEGEMEGGRATIIATTRAALVPKPRLTTSARNEEATLEARRTAKKQALKPPNLRSPHSGSETSLPTAFESKYGLPPAIKERKTAPNGAVLTVNRETVKEGRRSKSSEEVARARIRPSGASYDSAGQFSVVASLDASPTFQRLKLGTVQRGTLRGGKKWGENEVQLSNFKRLDNDLNYSFRQGSQDAARTPSARSTKYHTLDIGSKGFRRSKRSRESEQEWARKNYLTISKQKNNSRRNSKTFRSSRPTAKSTEDLSGRIYDSDWSLNSGRNAHRRPINPSPYKLQVQNSIRPNRKVEYRQGTRTKRKKIIANSIRGRAKRSTDHSFERELNVVDSPSSYMGFDIPLPPPKPTALGDIPEQKVPKSKDQTPSQRNTVNLKDSPSPGVPGKLNNHLGEYDSSQNQESRIQDRSVSVKSEHPYEEISFNRRPSGSNANKPNADVGSKGCLNVGGSMYLE